MGCNNSKLAAIQELAFITTQIKKENTQLEEERDRLKVHHDNRPEEEKDSLQDLRIMHSDLEKELKELKEIMLEFLPIPEQKDSSYLAIKYSIEKITNLQLELEEKTDLLRDQNSKRKSLSQESGLLDKSIVQVELQIAELDNTIQKQEWNLKDQGVDETCKKFEKQQSLVMEDMRNSHLAFMDIQEVSQESLMSDFESSSSGISSKKLTFQSLLLVSELEINKELKEVQTELDTLTKEIAELELSEVDKSQIGNYIVTLQEKLNFILKNSNFKEQIEESQKQIAKLKAEKKTLKQDIMVSKNLTREDGEDDISNKLETLDRILLSRNSFKENMEMSYKSDELIQDVQETIKKAREVSVELKKKHFYRQGS